MEEVTKTKTPEEWLPEFDVKILDPDGWRYDSTPMDKPLTRSEFKRRLIMCTLTGPGLSRLDWWD